MYNDTYYKYSIIQNTNSVLKVPFSLTSEFCHFQNDSQLGKIGDVGFLGCFDFLNIFDET